MTDVPDVDIKSLKVFCVLIDEGSVTRAAERLRIGQPAMSYTLARLRRAFGDPLLVRTGRGMVPTPRASELYQSIKDILARMDRLKTTPKFDPAKTPVEFTITGTEFIEYVLFPRLMQKLVTAAPLASISVHPAQPDRAMSLLELGEIDFRIGATERPPSALRSRPLFRDNLVSIVRKNHPILGRSMTFDAYASLAHVRPELDGKSWSARAVDKVMDAHRRKLHLSLRVRNYLTVPYVVANSDLAAIIPSRLATAFAETLPLVLFEPPFKLPTLQYSIYWHERSHASAPHRWLRQAFAEVARGLSVSPWQ